MTQLLRAAFAVAALTLTTTAHAQPPAARTDGKIGLGVGLTSGATAPDLGYLLFVPINVTPQLRVEPFVGWQRQSIDPDARQSDFTIGVGGFWVQPVATQLQLYAGGRLGSRWVSDRNVAGAGKRERRDTLLAVAAGGEYLPIPRVALGAEFQIGYVSVGDTKNTAPNGVVTEGGGGSGSATQATLFARIYLF